MRTSKTFLSFALLLTASLAVPAPHRASAAAGPWASNPQSRVRLITPWTVAPQASPNSELRLGLHFVLAPGWHVYWKNSGDAGFPPVVVLAKTPGLDGAELLWPAPHRFELPGGLVAFGYENEVVYPVRTVLRPMSGDADDRLRLTADVDYLVCQSDCVPYRYTLTLDQPLGAAPVRDAATAPLVDTWWNRLPVAAGSLPGVTTDGALVAAAPGAPGAPRAPVLEIRVRGAREASGGEPPGLFLEAHDAFDAGRPEVMSGTSPDGGILFRVPLKPHEAGKPLPQATPFAWTVTGLAAGGKAPVSLEARRTVSPGPGWAPASPPASPARAAGPVLTALLAVAATLAALGLWGLLGPVRTGRPGREALGFAAAAVTFAALWLLARQVSFVGLAGIELALLAMSLFAWLRRHGGSRPALSFLLALGLLACAAAAPWLAHRNRLDVPAGSRSAPTL